ncbi:hypothetical protein [Schaalia sp. ZJ1691]|nr:hypothetical protein [Schaalia sp. ZJ1691]
MKTQTIGGSWSQELARMWPMTVEHSGAAAPAGCDGTGKGTTE